MLLVGLLFYAEHYARQGHRNVEIQTSLLLSFLVGCQLGALFALRRTWPQDKRDKLIVAVAVAASAFWLTNVCLREPAELQIHSARPFAQAVEELRRQQPRRLAMYGVGKDSLAIVYHVNVADEFRPLFINQVEQLRSLHYPLYLLISDKESKLLTSAGRRGQGIEWPQPVYQGLFRDDDYSVYYLQQPPPQ
jgi:hypothetical protein